MMGIETKSSDKDPNSSSLKNQIKKLSIRQKTTAKVEKGKQKFILTDRKSTEAWLTEHKIDF